MKRLIVFVVGCVLTASILPASAEAVPPAAVSTPAAAVANGPFVADSNLVSPTTGVTTSIPNPMYDPTFAPDGSAVAGFTGETTGNGDRVLAMTVAGEHFNHRLAAFPGTIVDTAWSPDGRLVAVSWANLAKGRYRVSLVRVDKSRPPRLLLRAGSVPITDLDWRADTGELAVLIDARLVYVSRDGTQARNVEGGCSFVPPDVPTCTATPAFAKFDLSPDGASAVVERLPGPTLATITDDGSGAVTPLTDDLGRTVTGQEPLWSPDGTTIAFTNNDPQAPGLTTMPVGGGALRFVREYGVSEADDWQACPNGVCPRFGRKFAPNLSVTATVGDTTVTAHGVLFDGSFYGQPMQVALKRWSGERYLLVERTTTSPGREGHYRAVFSRPAPGKCRLVAQYAGEEFFYLPARTSHDFAC